jgi:hypothetical protein
MVLPHLEGLGLRAIFQVEYRLYAMAEGTDAP